MDDINGADDADAIPFRRRVDACRAALKARDVEAVICFPRSNMTYLSGFAEESMERHLLLFVTRDETVFLAPELYAEQLGNETWIEDRRTWADGDDPRRLIASVVADLGIESGDGDGGRVLLDDRMWKLFSRDIRRALPDCEFGLASEVMDDLRIAKDEHELERMRESAEITDGVSVAIQALGSEAVGLTETELAREIESRLTAAGGDGTSFEPVVGRGRTARCRITVTATG